MPDQPRIHRGVASCGDDFLTGKVKVNHTRCIAFVEMAMDSIANIRAQGRNVIGLREDVLVDCLRGIAPLGRLFNDKVNI